jgi:5'-3' exonuclease
VYKKVIGNSNDNIVNGSKIIWKNFRKIMIEIANTEEVLMHNEYKIRTKQSKNIMNRKMEESDRFVSVPMLDRSIEHYINPYEKHWQERYYNKLFKIDIDDDRRKQISINYLEGLEWTLKYYTTGCVDWRWKYNYNYPPLLQDLSKYIPYFDTTFIKENNNTSVSPLVQLSYVLPKKNLYLLPNKIEEVLLEKFEEIYTDTHNINWAFCKYFWESHIEFPHLSIDELENTIMPLCV